MHFKGLEERSRAIPEGFRSLPGFSSGFRNVLGSLKGVHGRSMRFQEVSKAFQECSKGFQGIKGVPVYLWISGVFKGFHGRYRGPQDFKEPHGLPGGSMQLHGLSWGPRDVSGEFQVVSEGVPGVFQEISVGFRSVPENFKRYQERSKAVLGSSLSFRHVPCCFIGVPGDFIGFQGRSSGYIRDNTSNSEAS